MSKKEKTKKITMLETRDVGTYGLKEADEDYTLPEGVANQLISQGLAKEFAKSPASKKSVTNEE